MIHQFPEVLPAVPTLGWGRFLISYLRHYANVSSSGVVCQAVLSRSGSLPACACRLASTAFSCVGGLCRSRSRHRPHGWWHRFGWSQASPPAGRSRHRSQDRPEDTCHGANPFSSARQHCPKPSESRENSIDHHTSVTGMSESSSRIG